MVWLAAIVNFAPLVGVIIALLWGKRLGEPKAAVVPVAALGVSFAAAVALFVRILFGYGGDFSYTWLRVGGFTLDVGFQLDRFGGIMAVVVAAVSFVIHVYSTGYMSGDKLYGRYFAYLNLFSAAMLGLVLANNYLQAFIFWELVGLTSYLLIGFWFEKPEAADAGMKAFITRRVGDVGLLVGIMLIFTLTGTFHFGTIFELVGYGALAPAMITVIALLIFAGAVGKSAQLPLHVWLPDAMEGPTPVSALIHAATMVAAGVYLVRRHLGSSRLRRRDDGPYGRDHSRGPSRHQTRARLFHHKPARLYDARARVRQPGRGDIPPLHARLLQGATLFGRRRRHTRVPHQRHARDGRPRPEDEGDRGDLRVGRARARGRAAPLRLLL
jgi:formate hydrogenlyase subunit 3/multisubunit Na+/H+ antiporter MnhD subunit